MSMDASINDALRYFETTEANLTKLERIWARMQSMVPSTCAFGEDPEHERLLREFALVYDALPAIDGWKAEPELYTLNEIAQQRFDAQEVAEPECLVRTEERITQPGRILREYRFKLDVKRRQLIRSRVAELIDGVDADLRKANAILKEPGSPGMPVSGAAWESLKSRIMQIHTLLGSSVPHPPHWSDLHRHLRFGLRQDLQDIIQQDWPAAKPGLMRNLYAENEPIPVGIDDLGSIAASRPRGPVPTELNWGALSAEDFERLIFTLISLEDGYENPEWLTHTNAPDRGRDLSVTRVVPDALSGPRRYRTILQCKHWLERSVSPQDVATLREQMREWEPPRVDVVVIVTSGRFTSDAVSMIEKHNESDRALRIEMWAGSHLERLLAERPALIAEFGLRRGR